MDKDNSPKPDDRTVIKNEGDLDEATPSRPKYVPPYVVVVEGPRAGGRFPLGDGPNVIGRAPGNAIRLEDQSVSRQHVEISKGASGWVVKDLGSKNGTLVNGKLISDAVVIGHKDVIKAGIYVMRLILSPASLEEEMTLPPELATSERTLFVTAPPESPTSEMRKKEVTQPDLPADVPEVPEPVEGDEGDKPVSRFAFLRNRQTLMLIALGFLMIVAAAFFINRMMFKAPKKVSKKPVVEKVAGEAPLPPLGGLEGAPTPLPIVPGKMPQGQAGALPPAGPQVAPAASAAETPALVQKTPVFLDFASSPLPAKVIFEEKELGQTPIRVNAELEPGKTYKASGLFVMPEIAQQYTQDVAFTVDKDKSVIPVFFRGPIGMIKVNNLPRDVQFYLEGKFSYDKFTEQTAKLKGIVLQKPIYIPFGSYFLELRRTRKLGESSPTTVEDIIFKRDFIIAEDSPTYTLEVKDEDLNIFPVKIKSDPPNADVFVDGKQVGMTPFDGTFPLGEHKLTLRKEGYFEHNEDLKVDINMPFVDEVKLKTSVAGAHINNARLAMSRQMYQEAVNELAEALNSQPAPSESALANYLLGRCYLSVGDTQRALGYFEQAKVSDEQRYPAMLGLANCYAIMNDIARALPLLVEVMLRNKDEQVKKDAHDLFQKISPFKSVVYVYSDPPGAQVIVNDRIIAQQTPLILHDLSLGNYRLRIEKAGYLSTDLNISLSVNEFNPVIVKLKPIPQ